MSVENNPLVSVYIPSHKRPQLARRAIESVLRQDYSPIEIVFCNDGSNDPDYLPLKDLVEKNNGQYLENVTPQGAPASRNRAIKVAKGHFITGLDDDDEFTENRIRMLVQSYGADYAFLATSYIEQSKAGAVQRTFNAGVIKFKTLLHYNSVGNQIFTETEKMRQCGGFDESLPAMQDYELWIRMAKLFGDGYKSSDLTYIVHTEHDSDRISSSSLKKEAAIKIIQAKHRTDLTQSHYNTHKLLIHRAKNTPLTIKDVIKYCNPSNFKLAIASYLYMKNWRK